jgi:hypothetical protein
MRSQKFRRVLYEVVGIVLVLVSIAFFWTSVSFLSERDYIAAILEIFVGFALVRAGLELTKIALIRGDRP